MSNRLSLGARTRLLFLGSAFLSLVAGLLVPWVRTGDIVHAYQSKAIDEALDRYEKGLPLGPAEVMLLPADDPQWDAIRRTMVIREQKGMGGIRTVQTR